MVTDEVLLQHIERVLSKLDSSKELHLMIADICFRCQFLIKEHQRVAKPRTKLLPKRDRAAYMRQYRAKHRYIGV